MKGSFLFFTLWFGDWILRARNVKFRLVFALHFLHYFLKCADSLVVQVGRILREFEKPADYFHPFKWSTAKRTYLSDFHRDVELTNWLL